MGSFFRFIGNVLYRLRWLLAAIFAVGVPLFVYLIIAKEPVFSTEDDVTLGSMAVQSMDQEPDEYPILPADEYPEAYAHLGRIVKNIIGSAEIQYRDVFAYDKMRIINRDDVLNAFCLPGGYIYVYTGLIKYLDQEDHLAGVLGHEIAHAERRHGSLRLQREYGVKGLSGFLLLTVPISASDYVNATIMRELLGLSYSRGQEAEADALSVRYLSGSPYACDGTAGFFIKLQEEGKEAPIPAFLSDHPDSGSRVQAIQRAAEQLGCSTEPGDRPPWQAFQASLPPGTGADADHEARDDTSVPRSPHATP